MGQSIKIITETEFNELHSKLDMILEEVKAGNGKSKESKTGDWITEKEAQDLLGRSTGTLWRMRKDGKLTSSKLNGKTYYSLKSIYKLLDKNKKNAYR